MNRTIKTTFNRINLIAALFLCSIFSFSAIAQDSPLNSQQLTNLITGLKGALQENLAVIENTNGKQYQAITKKWDARKDLAGKTKVDVIDLMYQDVKSVVTNLGMQYQIYQVFSFYGQIPDSQFSAKSGETDQTSFTDPRDGEVYGIKKVGNLTWMKENLRYSSASNPFSGSDGSWCYRNIYYNCTELGRLYTFEAAIQGCPDGWRLPTDDDWQDLEKALGMPQKQLIIDGYSTNRGNGEGKKLKVGGSSGLEFKISGFAYINNGKPEFKGIDDDDRPRSYFWTATKKTVNNETVVYRRRLEAKNGSIFRFRNPTEGYAVSVRCVK